MAKDEPVSVSEQWITEDPDPVFACGRRRRRARHVWKERPVWTDETGHEFRRRYCVRCGFCQIFVGWFTHSGTGVRTERWEYESPADVARKRPTPVGCVKDADVQRGPATKVVSDARQK
jgi:hypothetical protein